MRGGHTPKIAGRPVSTVADVAAPGLLQIDTCIGGVDCDPVVREGQEVAVGDALARGALEAGSLCLPSPAAGRVSLVSPATNDTTSGRVTLEPRSGGAVSDALVRHEPDRITADALRDALVRGGVWPLFWSSHAGGVPSPDGSEQPRSIIVSCVSAEPFRARGSVILKHSWEHVMAGMRFLPRLMGVKGVIEFCLTHARHPLAVRIYKELAGQAWVRFRPVPLRYPVEHPTLLNRALRRSVPSVDAADAVWVIDVQGVAAVGACLASAVPLRRRVVALGGPGCEEPRHVSVPVGTPVSEFAAARGGCKVLRGGLLRGLPVDVETAAVRYDDDAFFFLPEPTEREFIGFMNPGFDRTSILPCFVSRLTGAPDRRVSTLLRGELRPCVACGLCEKVCPARLFPQVLHRLLYGDQIDEAEAAGLERCIDCGLCTYVCPSKIELQEQFTAARQQIREEREEMARAADREEPPSEGGAWGGPLA